MTLVLRVDREPSEQAPNRPGELLTWGDVYVDGAHEGVTLEDEVREIYGRPPSEWKIPKRTAIPAGTYRLGTRLSPHFGPDAPVLLDVPGYTLVEIHGGTTIDDTDGCIMVGSRQDRIDGTLHGARVAQRFGDVVVPPVYATLKTKIRDAITNLERAVIQVRNAPAWYAFRGIPFPKALA